MSCIFYLPVFLSFFAFYFFNFLFSLCQGGQLPVTCATHKAIAEATGSGSLSP